MRRVPLLALPVLAAAILSWPTGLRAQDTKTASGTVTAVGADSVTVKVMDKDMTFNVDAKTDVIASGAGHKAKAAQEKGMTGPKLADVLKVGQPVEIKYHDMGGTLHAASIRAVASAGGGGGSVSEPTKTLTGTVKAVAADSLTVTGADMKDMVFSVDAKTLVVGTGIGTASAAKGGKATVADLLGMGDKVTVQYHETAGTNHATYVRRTSKAKTSK
jgi:uncharacterized protein DUF5666